MNKANYRKGKRQEIITLLHYCGSIPYSAINYLEENKKSRMYHASINKMQKEGVVKIEKKNGERQLVLKDYDELSPIYVKAIDEMYRDYYLRVGQTLRKIALHNDKKDAGKVLQSNDMILLMYSIGVKTLPTDKADILNCDELPQNVNMYYNSREIKKGTNYESIVEENNQQKTVIGTRIDGLLISNGGIYTIYNMRNKRYVWKVRGEERIKPYIEKLINGKHPRFILEKNYECKDAILFAKQLSSFAKMLTDSPQNDSFKDMIGLRTLYTNIYVLPSDINGKMMLEIMMMKDWKNKMLSDLFDTSDEERNEAKHTSVVCDGYDEETKTYKLLFCIPNLAKLYMFSNRAKIEENQHVFEVYCFDFQAELVVAVTEGMVKVKKMPFEKYYQFIKEGEEITDERISE